MNKWLKRGIIAVVVLGVVGAVGVGMAGRSKAKEEKPRFRTAQIDQGSITQVVLASGSVQPVTSVNVGTQVSGTVAERLADFNDRVKAGQVLLKLDPAIISARIRQADAQLASAQASLALAQSTYDRNQRLRTQGFISANALDQNRREFDAARANVDVAKAQLDQARTDLSNSVIRSPIDGVVIRRNIDVGQTVAASFQTPDLYQIAKDLTKMQIHASVSEADVGLIKQGQQVRFLVDAFPEREFEGKVEQFRLNPTNTSGVVTYTIVIGFDNPDELLKPGMTAQTRIVVASKSNVMRIPTAALRFTPSEEDLKDKNKPKDKQAASAVAASAVQINDPRDDGVLTSIRGGQRVYRVYTVGEGQKPVLNEVTIGISNTKFTELVQSLAANNQTPLKAGDQLITRSLSGVPGAND